MTLEHVRARGPAGLTATGVLCLLAVSLVVARPAGQQQPKPPPQQPPPQQPSPQQPTPIFRVGVNAVRVDVTVTGRDGKPVDDLTDADLEVLEDGVPQKIQAVQFLRLDGQERPGDNDSLEIRSPEHAAAEAARDDVRLFAIFLDDYHIPRTPAINIPLRHALVNFVQHLGPTDLVTIMDPLTPLSDLELTRDRMALIARIRAFEGRRGEFFPVRGPIEEAQLYAGSDLWRLRAEVTLSALEALVTYLGGLRDGRKSVLFVSQGPPYTTVFQDLEPRVRDILQAANRANVTINVLDPSGLGNRPSDVLYRLAGETGGRTIVNTNNLSGGLAQVIADASAYYLIGYAPARDFADGKFHRIEVKTKRRGLRIEARPGYWAPSAREIEKAAETAARPAVPGVSHALSALAAPNVRRPVDVWVGFTRGANGLTRMDVAWLPSGGSSGAAATVRLEVQPIEPKDKKELAAAQVLTTVAGSDVRPFASFDLKPGPAALRLTARAADDHVADEWQQAITVPALAADPLTLATPRFYRAFSVPEYRRLIADAHPAPIASRDFRHTDRVLVEVEVYAEGVEPPVVTVELLGETGQPLAALPVPPLSGGTTRVELPLASLANGTYLLRVRARSGERMVEHLDAFRVVP